MRQFETLLHELDIAGWTAVQGNRSSISASVVEANKWVVRLKKANWAFCCIYKTLDQKKMALLWRYLNSFR
jgi:hypothetical protein